MICLDLRKCLCRKILEHIFCHSVKCYNQLQKYLRHCTIFSHKWPVHDLVLVIPPPPLITVSSNTRLCPKPGGTLQLWRGGRREVSIISHGPVISSDLKPKGCFFAGVSQHFCNWLWTCLFSIIHKLELTTALELRHVSTKQPLLLCLFGNHKFKTFSLSQFCHNLD